jgi:hypothetical protein
MPVPTGYSEWGYLGAVIFLVVAFGWFLIRRDKEWRDFFTGVRLTDSEATSKLTAAIDKLVARVESLEDRFSDHDTWEHTKLDEMSAAINRPTRPRKGAAD